MPYDYGLGSLVEVEQEDNWLSKIGQVLMDTAAGMQGKPPPSAERRMQRHRMLIDRERLGIERGDQELRKQQQSISRFNVLFDFLKNFEGNEEQVGKVVNAYFKTFPDADKMLRDQGIEPEKLQFSKKGTAVSIPYITREDGQFNDSITGQPIPKDTPVTLRGEFKRDQGWVTHMVTPNAVDPKTGDQIFAAAAKQKYPDDPVKQADYIRTLRNNPESWQNVAFNDALNRHKGDVQAATKEMIGIFAQTSGARAAGAKEGELSVTSRPDYQQTQREVAQARSEGATAGRPIDPTAAGRLVDLMAAQQQTSNIESSFSKDFLGPIKGTQTAFEARRRVGSYIGSPLGEKETTFRQSLADIKDQLLRARSGAQINEQEYKRLSQMLPAATDEPGVFQAGMRRFKAELDLTIKSKLNLAVTPRGQIDEGTITPPSRSFNFVPGKGLVPTQ